MKAYVNWQNEENIDLILNYTNAIWDFVKKTLEVK